MRTRGRAGEAECDRRHGRGKQRRGRGRGGGACRWNFFFKRCEIRNIVKKTLKFSYIYIKFSTGPVVFGVPRAQWAWKKELFGFEDTSDIPDLRIISVGIRINGGTTASLLMMQDSTSALNDQCMAG